LLPDVLEIRHHGRCKRRREEILDVSQGILSIEKRAALGESELTVEDDVVRLRRSRGDTRIRRCVDNFQDRSHKFHADAVILAVLGRARYRDGKDIESNRGGRRAIHVGSKITNNALRSEVV